MWVKFKYYHSIKLLKFFPYIFWVWYKLLFFLLISNRIEFWIHLYWIIWSSKKQRIQALATLTGITVARCPTWAWKKKKHLRPRRLLNQARYKFYIKKSTAKYLNRIIEKRKRNRFCLILLPSLGMSNAAHKTTSGLKQPRSVNAKGTFTQIQPATRTALEVEFGRRSSAHRCFHWHWRAVWSLRSLLRKIVWN